jgi:hypothetical protein
MSCESVAAQAKHRAGPDESSLGDLSVFTLMTLMASGKHLRRQSGDRQAAQMSTIHRQHHDRGPKEMANPVVRVIGPPAKLALVSLAALIQSDE